MGSSGSVHKHRSRATTPADESRPVSAAGGPERGSDVGVASVKPEDNNPDILSPGVSGERRESLTIRTFSMEPKDLMISYSHQDRDKMRQMRDALEGAGITVWVDETGLKAGVEFLNKIGQAIIDAKLFLSLLSTKSATSKYCKDELALAYVSSKPIFPCMIESAKEVTELMDFGMRLQLAPIRRFNFEDESKFEDSFSQLAASIKAKLKELDDANREGQTGKKHPVLKRRETRTRLNVHQLKVDKEEEKKDFWQSHFQGQTSVSVEDFMVAFKEECTDELAKIGVTLEWIIPVLTEELDEEQDNFISHDSYEHFCIIDEERQEFWQRVKEQALERYTMLEVFSMDSTVRIDAIQNLAKFRSRSVVEAMMDLCADRDDNVRAVAALSLARVAPPKNLRVVRRLLRLLKDRDRLVRQSGCLALGHMKARQAVPSLVNLWRNDAISNVREAAHMALEKIGGDEAQEAIHITKVLSAEIKALAQAK
ncbi:uncharacterized protein [Diadema setosum]|uniref:uncharacterized protein n=1 Tax=Diadema setosum TaxID=31175 RepID=UPI003B3AD598